MVARYKVMRARKSDAVGGWPRTSYACTSFRPNPTTLEQGIADRSEETIRAQAGFFDSSCLEFARSTRDPAFFDLAIDSKRRACDLVKLRLDDV
jgi:hypothetical protein